jgi:hypothetical protein
VSKGNFWPGCELEARGALVLSTANFALKISSL